MVERYGPKTIINKEKKDLPFPSVFHFILNDKIEYKREFN
jgi:hypothetical protein